MTGHRIEESIGSVFGGIRIDVNVFRMQRVVLDAEAMYMICRRSKMELGVEYSWRQMNLDVGSSTEGSVNCDSRMLTQHICMGYRYMWNKKTCRR